MYPLPINFVGLDGPLAQHLRRELADLPAEVKGEFRDASAVLSQRSAGKSETRLLVIQVRGDKELVDMRRLLGGLPGWPIVALVDDPSLTVRANRAGAAQVVLIPVQPEDFTLALRSVGQQFGYLRPSATLLAVTGVTGGCGATSLALNLAAETAASRAMNCVLVELAQQMGVVAALLDLRPRVTLPDLLAAPERVDAYLVQQSLTPVIDNLAILPGPEELAASKQASAEDLFGVIDQTRELAEVVVLDVPGNFGDVQFEVLSRADVVVLVGEQTIPSVRAMKLMLDSLRAQRGEAGLHVVLNRFDSEMEGFGEADLARLLRAEQLAAVTADPAVKQAANKGMLLRKLAPRSRALADTNRVLSQVFGGEKSAAAPAKAETNSGLIRRLVGAFR